MVYQPINRVSIPCHLLVGLHWGPVTEFFIANPSTLHPSDFDRNLFINPRRMRRRVTVLALSLSHSFVHSIRSLIDSFVHPLVDGLIHSRSPSIIHSFIHLSVNSFIHSLIH